MYTRGLVIAVNDHPLGPAPPRAPRRWATPRLHVQRGTTARAFIHALLALVLALLLALASGVAASAVLYSTLGPADSYNGRQLQYVGWGDAVGQGFENQQVANRFTVTTDATVANYRVAVSHFAVGDPGEGLLSLWSGSSAPTTLIEADIGFDIGRGPALIAEVASLSRPLLTAGEVYWLVLAAGSSPELYRWYLSDLTPSPAWGPQIRMDPHGWNPVGTVANAFEVNGASVPMPEPASGLLVAGALGLLALTGSRNRRR